MLLKAVDVHKIYDHSVRKQSMRMNRNTVANSFGSCTLEYLWEFGGCNQVLCRGRNAVLDHFPPNPLGSIANSIHYN